MILEEEGKILRDVMIAAYNKQMQATAEYETALDAYDKYLDRSIEAINQAQRAIRELK